MESVALWHHRLALQFASTGDFVSPATTKSFLEADL